jgi:hypothetical protein
MFGMPGVRGFAIAADQSLGRVSCNAHGIFIGSFPLLEQVNGRWKPRPTIVLNDKLTACYRLPFDIAAKANALSLIATVQMQIPDPPSLAKGLDNPEDLARRARELARSGLLKVWDPEEHPRAGMASNPGWFAPQRLCARWAFRKHGCG